MKEPQLKLAVCLPINPPTATAQMRKIRVVYGRPQIYDPKSVKMAKAILSDAFYPYIPDEPYHGALSVSAVFAFGTKDKKKIRGEYRTTRPDLDNLWKACADILMQQGYFDDDSIICDLYLRKIWVAPEDAHLSLTISEFVEVDNEG